MFKIVLTFLVFWGIITGGIALFRQASGKEKLSILKYISYGAVTALIASLSLFAIVQLF